MSDPPFDASFDCLDDALSSLDVDRVVAQRPAVSSQDNRRPTRTSTTSSSSSSSNIERTPPCISRHGKHANDHDDDDHFSSPSAEPPPPPGKRARVTFSSSEADLRATLRRVFGYSDFRQGQLPVVQALLGQRDVSVYWATGQGKSLCYQIPALHTNQVALVVSPLISLMQDQCHKLNALSTQPLAAYVGSAQTDGRVEHQAWTGSFAVVYLTPEKLVTCRDAIVRLHTHHKRIAVIAIDEAHCVSEWGTDFRPDFRRLACLRQPPQQGKDNNGDNDDPHHASAPLSDIPILTLTATAVPRVQRDIAQVLHLRQPLISRQSLDRHNLRLVIRARSANLLAALDDYLNIWNDPDVHPAQQSTILYVATRKEVEQVAATLARHVTHPKVAVGAYHAGLSPAERQRTHAAFLTGQCTVLVATVAFGMGIDKPDTRRIIHYGPPKTMEEYYQQIGRAGRDGAAAEAVLYANRPDFDKYQSDFYVGNLPPEPRAATLQSLQALKQYCLDKSQCRRVALLQYFGEHPHFPYCHNCDYCEQRKVFGDDMERDFRTVGAHLVLYVIESLQDQPLGQICNAIAGKSIEPYRCRIPVETLQANVQTAVAGFPRKFPKAYFEQLLSALQQKSLVATKHVKSVANGYARGWNVYMLTPAGRSTLLSQVPIILPVPECLRDTERKEKERQKRILQDLQKSAFKDKIPSDELERGDGEVIRSYAKWNAYVEKARGLEKVERTQHLELLFSLIEKWRSETATKIHVAPVSVIPEHMVASIAYAVATLTPGSYMDASSLNEVGVRSREIQGLVTVLREWVDNYQSAPDVAKTDGRASMMILGNVPARTPWKYAVYKPNKKTGKAVFELSYDRYCLGESIQSIAMNPGTGRPPIQAKTVANHILDAMVHGKPVNVDGVVAVLPLPTLEEWEKIETAHSTMNMDAIGDPEISGVDGNKYTLTDALRPIVPKIADTASAERTESERAILSHWFDKLKWFLALKRGGIDPTFR